MGPSLHFFCPPPLSSFESSFQGNDLGNFTHVLVIILFPITAAIFFNLIEFFNILTRAVSCLFKTHAGINQQTQVLKEDFLRFSV